MTETDNIVLEHLGYIHGAVDALRDDMREVKHRVGSLEREVAQVHVKVAELSERVDRVSDHLERVEERLDLTDA
jgi:predicted  nucleic acid-binding Zn-ribbon protein